MPEFPPSRVTPAFSFKFFNTYSSINSIGGVTGSLGAPASGAFPAANRAIFIPFKVLDTVNIVQLWAYNGATVSGNFDLGIYDRTGARIVSTGSVAQTGASVIQFVSISPVILSPGLFYLAIAANNTTATFFRATTTALFLRVLGVVQQGVFPLPATATFAAVASAYLPVIGFTARTV